MFGKKSNYTDIKEIQDKLSDEQVKRCIPLAVEILKKLGNYGNLQVGKVKDVEFNKVYKDLAQDIKQMFLEKEVRYIDIELIIQLIRQPIDTIAFILNDNFKHQLETIEKNQWGKEKYDWTVKDIDEKLKSYENKQQ